MRKYLLILLAALNFTTYGRQISIEEASSIASEFFNSPTARRQIGKQASAKRIQPIAVSAENTTLPYYIFNGEDNGGFVIVSGDDRTKTILGYSYAGNFDVAAMPDNVQYLLKSYTKLIKNLPDDAKAPVFSGTQDDVQYKLIKTANWNQGDPFNRKCPTDENGIHYVTGCTPTATAILIKSHCWPPTGIGEWEYRVNDEVYHVDFRDRVYNWKKMPDDIDANTCSDEEANEVSQLMADIGYASHANYGGVGGTGASPDFASEALIGGFGYAPTIYTVNRIGCDSEFFMNIIRTEIDNGRPIIVDSSNTPDESLYAHCYIADGYDENGNVHFNFGWGGSYNGFYTVDVAESFAGVDISLYYGIQPDNSQKKDITNEVIYVNREHFRHISDNTIKCRLCFTGASLGFKFTRNWSYGYAAKNMNTGEITIFDKSQDSHVIEVSEITVDDDINDGEYEIYPVSKFDDGEWCACPCNEYFQSYVELTVKNGVKQFRNTEPKCTDLDKGKVEIDGIIYILDEYSHTAEVTYRNSSFGSYSGTVVIPSTLSYNGVEYNVTRIGGSAFRECYLEKVILPETITEIESGAFSGYIDEVNFENLINLEVLSGWSCNMSGYKKKFILPPNIKEIQTYVVSGTTLYNTPMLEIPETVEQIYGSPFPSNGFVALKVNWEDPAKVSTPGASTFSDSYHLQTIYVPDGTKEKYENIAPWNLYEIIEVPDEIIPAERIEVLCDGSPIQKDQILEFVPNSTVTFKVNIYPENATFDKVSLRSNFTEFVYPRNGNEYETFIGNVINGVYPFKVMPIDDVCPTLEFYIKIEEPKKPILVTSLSLSPDNWNGVEGEQFKINATVLPENAENKTLEWNSSDESVAMVDDEGTVTVCRAGNCIITARTTDGSNLFAECTLTGFSSIDEIYTEAEDLLDIYNLQGILIKANAGRDDFEKLSSGVYVVRQNATTRKIIIQ